MGIFGHNGMGKYIYGVKFVKLFLKRTLGNFLFCAIYSLFAVRMAI